MKTEKHEKAASEGHLDNLIYHLGKNNYFDVSKLYYLAARGGHLHIIKFLVEKKYYGLNDETIVVAAEEGRLNILKYFVELGYKLDSCEACIAAIENDNFECLKYIFENGCKWYHINDKLVYQAAYDGRLEMLKYLNKIYGPSLKDGKYEYLWSKEACKKAASNGHLDCLSFLHQIGCYWDEESCKSIISQFYYGKEYKHIDCLMYLLYNKCDDYKKYDYIFRDLYIKRRCLCYKNTYFQLLCIDIKKIIAYYVIPFHIKTTNTNTNDFSLF